MELTAGNMLGINWKNGTNSEYARTMGVQWEFIWGYIYIYIDILWDCNENILEYISLHLNIMGV